MTGTIKIEEGQTSVADQSKWIRREVERLMVQQRYQDGYDLYLTDPTLETPPTYDDFVANNA